MTDHSHEGIVSLTLAEHAHVDGPAGVEAKRVVLALNTGAGYAEASGTAMGELNIAGTINVGTVTVQEPLSVDDNGGSLTVDSLAEHAEDVAHVSGDIGFLMLAVRNEGLSSLTDSNGDYSPIAVTARGKPIVSFGATVAVDLPYTLNDSGAPALAMRNDNATGSTTDANFDYGLISTDDKGRVMITGTSTMTALKVDGSAVTQPVSGTIAVTQPVAVTDNSGSLTVDNAGTFAVQDSQKIADNTVFTDGTTPLNPVGFIFDEVAGTAVSENDIVAARVDIKRAIVTTIEDATTRGRRMTVSAAGAASVGITSFSAALPAGTNNIGDVDVLTVPAPLNVVGSGTQATALRTSTATDSAEVVSLAIMDDWDESDRAKVNPIAGQAGVQGNTGTVNALTQRVVLATDVALPTGTNFLGSVKISGQSLTADVTTYSFKALETHDDEAIIKLTSIKNNLEQCVTGQVSSNAEVGPAILAIRNDGASTTLAASNAIFTHVAADSFGRLLTAPHPPGVYYTHDFTVSPTTDTAQDITSRPCGLWALQVAGVGGTPTAWDLRLQVSLDGTSFTQILQHVSGTNPLGSTLNLGLATIAAPARYFRLFLSNAVTLTLSGATSLRAHVLGVPA